MLYSAVTIVRLFALYQPLRTFTYLSLPFFLVGGGYCSASCSWC